MTQPINNEKIEENLIKQPYSNARICPNCGVVMHPDGGCSFCPVCGESKCS